MAQELKAFDVQLGRYTEDGSPCVVAIDVDQNPRILNEQIYLKSEADKVIDGLENDIRKLLKEYHNTIDSNDSLRIAATESMRIVKRKNMALMKCRRLIAHLNSLLSNSVMGKLKYDRQFGYWNGIIMDEKFNEAK